MFISLHYNPSDMLTLTLMLKDPLSENARNCLKNSSSYRTNTNIVSTIHLYLFAFMHIPTRLSSQIIQRTERLDPYKKDL